MKRIVVGTDLSARATGAVAYAAELAAQQGATLHVVSVVPPPMTTADAMVPSGAFHDHAVSTTAVEERLQAEAARLRHGGLEVEVHVCTGSPADVLCKVAEAVDAELVVVGNRRMRGAGRLLGSVASKVAHHAPCSVLIARTGD